MDEFDQIRLSESEASSEAPDHSDVESDSSIDDSKARSDDEMRWGEWDSDEDDVPQKLTLLRKLGRRAEKAFSDLDKGIATGPFSIGWSSSYMFERFDMKKNWHYRHSWGMDSLCRPSFNEEGHGEILLWGDDSNIHYLPRPLVNVTLKDNLMNNDREYAMAIHHRVPGGGLKYADGEWAGDNRRQDITVMEVAWANESIECLESELEIHRVAGFDFIGIVLWFDGVRGDAAALAKLEEILKKDPDAKLEDYVSILFIVGQGDPAEHKKNVWRIGQAAKEAVVSGPTVEHSGSTPLLPHQWFTSKSRARDRLATRRVMRRIALRRKQEEMEKQKEQEKEMMEKQKEQEKGQVQEKNDKEVETEEDVGKDKTWKRQRAAEDDDEDEETDDEDEETEDEELTEDGEDELQGDKVPWFLETWCHHLANNLLMMQAQKTIVRKEGNDSWKAFKQAQSDAQGRAEAFTRGLLLKEIDQLKVLGEEGKLRETTVNELVKRRQAKLKKIDKGKRVVDWQLIVGM